MRAHRNFLLACLLTAAFCALAACGFSPIYGSHGSNSAPIAEELNEIAIDNIPDRQGQMLRNNLIDRMYVEGRPERPLYTLTIKVRISTADVGTLANSTAVLTQMNTYADYTLTDLKGTKLVTSTAHSSTSYGQLSDMYATLAAHDSAVERTLNEVSEQILNRLSLYFANPPPPTKPVPVGTQSPATSSVLFP